MCSTGSRSLEGRAFAEPIRTASGLRVLLVEDEPLIALDARDTLEALGVAEVVWARSVADGLNDPGDPDVPCRPARPEARPRIQHPLGAAACGPGVPFGFLTGYQGDAIPPEFKGAPIVPKPFTANQLGDLLRTLVAVPLIGSVLVT